MTAKIKTLIVSSDPMLLGFLQQNLNGGNCEVVCTNRMGEELKAVLERELADLVILDIMMPSLDGIEVCLKIRQWSRVPIMMLSAWGAGEGKVRGLNLSASSYLTEPFGIDELMARIGDALQRNLAATNSLSNVRSGVS
ncbi:MAG: response regulator transcription factor [Dehalococcoidales bacterium]|nr:response regulator transcription factor [Dehalococcoidales bacterium]